MIGSEESKQPSCQENRQQACDLVWSAQFNSVQFIHELQKAPKHPTPVSQKFPRACEQKQWRK